jgi:hypothetical protein
MFAFVAFFAIFAATAFAAAGRQAAATPASLFASWLHRCLVCLCRLFAAFATAAFVISSCSLLCRPSPLFPAGSGFESHRGPLPPFFGPGFWLFYFLRHCMCATLSLPPSFAGARRSLALRRRELAARCLVEAEAEEMRVHAVTKQRAAASASVCAAAEDRPRRKLLDAPPRFFTPGPGAAAGGFADKPAPRLATRGARCAWCTWPNTRPHNRSPPRPFPATQDQTAGPAGGARGGGTNSLPLVPVRRRWRCVRTSRLARRWPFLLGWG